LAVRESGPIDPAADGDDDVGASAGKIREPEHQVARSASDEGALRRHPQPTRLSHRPPELVSEASDGSGVTLGGQEQAEHRLCGRVSER
jgi:hypothetical protein